MQQRVAMSLGDRTEAAVATKEAVEMKAAAEGSAAMRAAVATDVPAA